MGRIPKADKEKALKSLNGKNSKLFDRFHFKDELTLFSK